MAKTLRLILGDQLNIQHSWYQEVDDSVRYLMMEMRQETDYVTHHIQKIVGFFLSMRTFAQALTEAGHQVIYLNLDDPENQQNLKEQLNFLISKEGFERFEYQLPDEYRLDKILKDICEKLPIPSASFDTEHFLTTRDFLKDFFKGKKTYLMETFYREMRKKYNILMDDKEPLTGQWNYDHDNRASLKDKKLLQKALIRPKKVSEIVELLEKSGVKTIGKIDAENYPWPVSRAESLEILEYFCENLLMHFGAYQDALTTWDPYLFHSRLSFSMNTKMISPLEVVQTVEKYWYQHQNTISIAQVEGFIRQIIGWREYMRGIYWAKMPEFSGMNFFGHDNKLPDWFWTGNTKMNCLKQSIGQSLDLAYAHHIQRLMVTGNFALLAGIHPDEVDQWYLGIYIDAIEWVEITNTRGMSQFADGGIVGTKPYVSSANYIKKQGNYCSGCAYDSNKKAGQGACPFNSLYWHFYDRNRDKLEKNPRIGMAYRTWDKMKNQKELIDQAEQYLGQLDQL
ncbi:cryptochrome/photolyase family protein [Algoriphagus sp.]|jgi:deoxyribodipyrimidine photolyase-related protein|uniref:cryptochrome/photolyase family protein n=1 Tax=Algoriphagus sp. TaxID=1872435 RepID=UPI00271AE2C1|nr:cryptochrome/photolyase family protein [Algoriphagus sp.]MDO8966605.1 cryptochrome/photolyase family protein [Algoriphagus sp.]MDP3202051.1 cryptochrome/photolyase family protein [Algoriphagus sp.]